MRGGEGRGGGGGVARRRTLDGQQLLGRHGQRLADREEARELELLHGAGREGRIGVSEEEEEGG